MILKIGTTSSQRNVIDKVFTQTGNDINLSNIGYSTHEIDKINPIIELLGVTPINCNYAYIDTFSRWYYIERVELVKGGQYRLYMKVDVLKSFASQIKSASAHIVRCGNVNSPYIRNTEDILTAKLTTETIDFPTGLGGYDTTDAYDIYLLTSGKGSEPIL